MVSKDFAGGASAASPLIDAMLSFLGSIFFFLLAFLKKKSAYIP
jgi:hypothetical protein